MSSGGTGNVTIFTYNIEGLLRGDSGASTEAAIVLLEPGDIVCVPERIL